MHVASPQPGLLTNAIIILHTKRKIHNWETHSRITLTCQKTKRTSKTPVTIISHSKRQRQHYLVCPWRRRQMVETMDMLLQVSKSGFQLLNFLSQNILPTSENHNSYTNMALKVLYFLQLSHNDLMFFFPNLVMRFQRSEDGLKHLQLCLRALEVTDSCTLLNDHTLCPTTPTTSTRSMTITQSPPPTSCNLYHSQVQLFVFTTHQLHHPHWFDRAWRLHDNPFQNQQRSLLCPRNQITQENLQAG